LSVLPSSYEGMSNRVFMCGTLHTRTYKNPEMGKQVT